MLKTGWHPVVREWLLMAALLMAGIALAVEGDWFYRIDQTFYDQALSLWNRPADADLVIVGIDEESLKQIGRWPWRRGIHATLVDRLTEAGAKAVVFDVILTDTDARDPAGDAALAKSLRANGRAVLPVVQQVIDGAPVGDALPAPLFAEAAPRVGHVHAHLDADGMLRRAFLRAGYGSPRHDLLSVAGWGLAEPAQLVAWRQRHLPADEMPQARAWVIEAPFLIPFAGPPGHYPKIPYIDVLRQDVAPQALHDKIVLVGITATGMGDEYPTPVSGLSRAMSGVEIHANVLQGLRQGVELRDASPMAAALTAMAIVLALLTAFPWLSPRRSLALTVLLCVGALLASALLFRLGQIWISPVVPVVFMMLAYPIWSWRRLEAAQRYLDDELAHIQSEPLLIPVGGDAPERAAADPKIPDVIERRIAAVRAAGQRLRDMNRFVADSLESLPEAAIVTDTAGVVRLTNSSAQRLLAALRPGQAGVPLVGRNFFELLAGFQAPGASAWSDLWARAGADVPVVSLEVKAGDDGEYLMQIAPAFSQAGARSGTIVTLTDVSPLRESERRRDEALRFLSHDMRAPQASILTLLEMQETAPDLMPTAILLTRIGKYARRTLTLADDFLRLAKAERARPQDFVVVSLDESLRDAAEEAWTLASGKRIDIQLAPVAGETLVRGDRDLLTRALINLLSNAIKYSPPQTTIHCRLVRDQAGWRVDIADQGYGIAAENMSKLFTRFTRLQAEGQPEVDGIGLGLVFVKTVVERHGGSIAVQSQVAGVAGTAQGTTFTLRLPAAD